MRAVEIAHWCYRGQVGWYFAHLRSSQTGRRLARGAFWGLVGMLVSRGLTLAASVVVARLLGKTAFGELGMVRSTVEMLSTFAGFSIGLTATKHVAQFRASDPLRVGRVIALTELGAVIMGALMGVVLYGAAPYIAHYVLGNRGLVVPLRVGSMLLLLSTLDGAQIGSLAGSCQSGLRIAVFSSACDV